ncbi:collagen alpha-1(XII) chain-like isoform X2 [Dreissena polymorpha]|uniref:collagen alpha-1(XII) chain-like isoform X2 n=1 Tax=Dreissena polymorpha TaxID=45954 RepID=UPI002264EDAB|nr:collagen alpha-1(XII) chain-like isoform X2 [Dreissena polymorpha]
MNRMLLVALVAAQGALGAATTAAPADCGSSPSDIVFLLDSSGSVGDGNFMKQLDFVSQFAQTFDIGPRHVQIGVVTFADTPHNEFNLNTYTDKNALVAAIKHITYNSGGTATDLALDYVKANSFTKPAGDRDNVANILIVMTDGQSNNSTETAKSAAALHAGLNAKVFVIGIGAGVSTTELGVIASDNQHVFSVSSFNALTSLQAELKKTACTVDGDWTSFGSYSPCTKTCGGGTQFHERSCTNPPPANGGAQCIGQARENKDCNTQACPTIPPATTTTAPTTTPIPTTLASDCGSSPSDIVFLLDSSGSVGDDNFMKQLDFVSQFAQTFDIGPRNVQIGVVTFADTPHNEFNLNTYTDKNALVAAIKHITYISGDTYTHFALDYVKTNSFTKPAGDRNNVTNILIVMTDGRSNAPAETVKSAAALHAGLNAKVFVIGIGSGVSTSELEVIASDNQHVFSVSSFDALTSLQAELKKTACTVDGGWTSFGSYYPCTKTCGGGTQFHERSCTNPPPANGGAQCVGQARENEDCNTQACPTISPATTTTTPKTTPISTTLASDCGSNPSDIVFLLDSSGSVGAADFMKQLHFVSRFAQTFDIGPRNVQIGVVTFATTPHNEFNLNTYTDKNALVAAIQNITYISGTTATDLALNFVKAYSFTKPAGDRDNVANILIVMTDGQSNSHAETVKSAAALHAGLNAKVFAIGIGAGVSTTELGVIASDNQHVFSVSSFDALTSLQAELKKTACTVDGGWTSFGSYSPCTKTCGGGTQFHERSCTNPPPANGGAQCVGQARENEDCNTQACPTIPPATTTTAPTTTPISKTLASVLQIVMVTAGSVLFLLLSICLIMFVCRRRRRAYRNSESVSDVVAVHFKSSAVNNEHYNIATRFHNVAYENYPTSTETTKKPQ